MLRIDMLTVAGVNIEEEASELFAPGLLHCFTFIQLVSTNWNLPLIEISLLVQIIYNYFLTVST